MTTGYDDGGRSEYQQHAPQPQYQPPIADPVTAVDEARRRYLEGLNQPQHAPQQQPQYPGPAPQQYAPPPPPQQQPQQQLQPVSYHQQAPQAHTGQIHNFGIGDDRVYADESKSRWRKLASALGIPVGRSQSEIDLEAMISGIQVNLRTPKIIGVISGRGGVGKTSVAVMLANTIAQYRPGRSTTLVSIDHNGSAARRVIDVAAAAGKPTQPSSLVKFAADTKLITDTDRDSHLISMKSGLKVLGSSHDTGSAPVTPKEYIRGIEVLQTSSQVVVIDFGNTPDSPVYRTALDSLDALVMVMATEQDSVISGLELLQDIYGDIYNLGMKLRNRTLVMLNQRSADRPRVDEGVVKNSIRSLVDPPDRNSQIILDVPWDKHMATSAKINPTLVSKRMDLVFIQAASTVMGMLPNT